MNQQSVPRKKLSPQTVSFSSDINKTELCNFTMNFLNYEKSRQFRELDEH